jgi:hypothetical protein
MENNSKAGEQALLLFSSFAVVQQLYYYSPPLQLFSRKTRNCYIDPCSPRLFGGVRVVHLFSFICCVVLCLSLFRDLCPICSASLLCLITNVTSYTCVKNIRNTYQYKQIKERISNDEVRPSCRIYS